MNQKLLESIPCCLIWSDVDDAGKYDNTGHSIDLNSGYCDNFKLQSEQF